MISRQWRGLARPEQAQAYERHLTTETFPSLRNIEGFVDAQILKRALPNGIEFLVVTRWASMAAIEKFAGADVEAAVVPEKVQAMMVEYDRRARHYESPAMKRTWTIIGVADVAASFQWYQSLFGQPATRPHHDYFGQLLDADGTVLLCLHQWGAHDHPSLTSADIATPGNGLLLFFRVDDYDMAEKRARALVARFDEEPHLNPSTRTMEFSLRDPDGYYVTISAL
jgi:heme-degrading monooxygenase HmoA/catechol 2,3-dioxygenase-like lactoylglutathione lyase family enzyme